MEIFFYYLYNILIMAFMEDKKFPLVIWVMVDYFMAFEVLINYSMLDCMGFINYYSLLKFIKKNKN